MMAAFFIFQWNKDDNNKKAKLNKPDIQTIKYQNTTNVHKDVFNLLIKTDRHIEHNISKE